MLLRAGCTAGQCAREANELYFRGVDCRIVSVLALQPWPELAEMLRAVSQLPA